MKYPHERFAHDVAGMPCFAAINEFLVHIPAESMKNAVPKDDENCAIALGCKAQLSTPHVSVGRYRTDLALPHPQGVVKPGFGPTTWAVIRFKNSAEAKAIIIAADLEELGEEGATIRLLPTGSENKPEAKKKANGERKRATQQETNGKKDELTEMGVRILTGQRQR